MENAKKKRAEVQADFIKKYSNADLSKFNFEVDINQDRTVGSTAIYFKNLDVLSMDIKSNTFLNDKSMTKYLYSNKGHNLSLNDKSMTKHLDSEVKHNAFPKIWRIGGTAQELPKGRRHVGFYGKEYYWDNFPVEYVLPYQINQFKVYVNNTDYFMSNLPPLNITTKNNAKWNLKEPYFQSLVGTWIATYASGISVEHLTFKPDVPKQITSFMRFHLYFTVRRIMREFKTMPENGIQYIMNKYKANFLKDHTPKWTWQEVSGYKNKHLGQYMVDTSKFTKFHGPGVGFIPDLQNDYKKFIPNKSDGLTTQGTELLN